MMEITKRIGGLITKNVFYKDDDDCQPSDLMELIAMDGRDRAHLHESSRRFEDRPIVIVRLRFVIIL